MEKLQFYLRHSLNDLRVNGQRTVFALLCIAAGVAAIVSLQVLGVMIEDTLTGSLQESNKGDIRVYLPEGGGPEGTSSDRGEQEGVIASSGSFGQHLFPPSGIAQIRDWLDTTYPGQVDLTYRQAMTSLTTGISISAPAQDTNQPIVMPYLVDVQVYPFYGHVETEGGESLSEAILAPTDIVLSRNLADELDVQVGDVVRVAGGSQDFTVRGIVPTSGESAMENPLNALFGYYYLNMDAIDLFSDIDPGGDILYIHLQDPSRVEEINAAFEKRFPYLDTTTTGDLEELNSQISDILGQTVIIMGLISLLIGGIGIVNTMLVIVRRRTTEIAVLKTIGLEGEQVTMLFLVEAILMGIAGSLIGIVLGWIAALVLKSGGETLLGQELAFRFTLTPPVTGLVVGILVTAIFGLLPTLSAGQVRPNLVLRPTDSVVPTAGRARTFAAILLVMLALSLVAQVLVRDLLDVGSTVGEAYDTAVEELDNPPETEIPDSIRDVRIFNLTTGLLGVFLGEVFALTLLSGGLLSGWARRHLLLRIFRWLLFPVLFPILGFIFGYMVPAMLLLFVTFILVGMLYVVLWVIIWVVGRFLPTGPFVDLKLAMRSMLAAKGREASTLLALVVGVFTLSLVTMLAGTVTKFFNNILEQEIGGNVIVIAAGSGVVDQIDTRLASLDGVNSYAVVGNYHTELISMEDASTGQTISPSQLRSRADAALSDQDAEYFDYAMATISGRELDSNLPDVAFYKGRQLDPTTDAGQPVIVIPANSATLAAGMDVGDKLTFRVGGTEGNPLTGGSSQAREITFEVVGMTDRTSGQVEVSFGASSYAPIAAFGDLSPSEVFAIVDVDEAQMGALRRSLTEVPGVFVLETSLINDLINSLIDQFTSLPILVAALALFTGGVVIANSVALTTLERRREIGIMKAVGLQRERVLGMLLLEYGLMGFIGGLIGILIGGVSLLYVLVQTFGGQLGEVIPYGTAFLLMGLCVAIALVAAILTAWGASGERPLNVLRYE